jgi:hypothetical protein
MTSLLQAPRKSTLDAVPAGLREYPQWVCWRYGKARTDGKRAKVPVCPATGRNASTTAPETWSDFEEAATAEPGGVGFVLTDQDPFLFLDLDGVVNPETGEVVPWADEIVALLGSYTEFSPSRTGLRIAVRARLPFGKRGKPPVEFFSSAGFVTITGDVFLDAPIQDRQSAVEALCKVYLPETPPKPAEGRTAPLEAILEPLPDGGGLTDRELLDKARASRGGERFAALYDRGDASPYGDDLSRADMALMARLAYWTQKDPERMERMFSASALGRREKWRTRRDYRRRTVDAAIRKTREVFDPAYRPKETSVRDRLAACKAYAVLQHPWGEHAPRADAAASDYFAYLALLADAHAANSPEVGMGERQLAERGGFASRETAAKALRRLEDEHGLVRAKPPAEGAGRPAARYEVAPKPSPRPADSILGQPLKSAPTDQPLCTNEVGLTLSQTPGLDTARILNAAHQTEQEFDRNGRRIPKGKDSPVRSVGKVSAWVLDLIHHGSGYMGAPVSLEWLESRTGIRRNNLKRRHLRKLLEAGLIEAVGDGYATPPDVGDRLERELEVSGCNERARLQRQRHERQRRIRTVWRLSTAGVDFDGISYRTGIPQAEIMGILKVPDHAPGWEDLDAMRERHEIRNADGYISELQREHPVFKGAFVDPAAEQPELPETGRPERGRFLVALDGGKSRRTARRGMRGADGLHHLYERRAAA